VLYAAPSRETYSRTNADENNPCTVFQPWSLLSLHLMTTQNDTSHQWNSKSIW
jgi:hypothetical protein